MRPPTVWTNRTDVGPTSGSGRMSGRWTAGKRMAAGPTRTVVAPMCPWPRWPCPTIRPSSTSMNARSSFASRNRSVSPKLLEIVQVVGRRLVVVGHSHLERDLREAGDRLRGDPGDRRDGRFDSGAGHRTVTSGRAPSWGPRATNGHSMMADGCGPVERLRLRSRDRCGGRHRSATAPRFRGAWPSRCPSIYLKASVPWSWSVMVRTPSATA